MEYKQINYDPLKRQILEQAFASAGFQITEEQKQKLIEDKFQRAGLQKEAVKQLVDWHTDR